MKTSELVLTGKALAFLAESCQGDWTTVERVAEVYVKKDDICYCSIFIRLVAVRWQPLLHAAVSGTYRRNGRPQRSLRQNCWYFCTNVRTFLISFCQLGNTQKSSTAAKGSFFQQLFRWSTGLNVSTDPVFIFLHLTNCSITQWQWPIDTINGTKCSGISVQHNFIDKTFLFYNTAMRFS